MTVRPWVWVAFCLCMVLLASACRQDTVLLDPSPNAPDTSGVDSLPPDTTPGDTSTSFRRATMSVAVRAPEAEAIMLGWGDGRIPGATVTIQRTGSSTRLSGVTDVTGVVEFPDLLEGAYRVSAVRVLSDTERALIQGSIDAYGGATSAGLAPPSGSVTVSAAAGSRGSLIISEWSFFIPVYPGIGDYPHGGYVELYNSGDSTVFLGGLTFGVGFASAYDSENFPCSLYDAVQNDPRGVWAELVYRFPGPRSSHPLAPGETAVLATDAVDHSQLVPDGLNLQGAQFEWVGGADVDNPSAANMVDIGPRTFAGLGHGFFSASVGVVPFVALPLAMDTLLLTHIQPNSRPLRLIPEGALLDVMATRSGDFGEGWTKCLRLVHESIDRQDLIWTPPDPASMESLQRQVVAFLPDGRRVLLRTFTSAQDFSPGQPTPFTLLP